VENIKKYTYDTILYCWFSVQ